VYNDAPVSQEIPEKPNSAIKLTYSCAARAVRMFPLHYAIFSALWPLKAIIKQLLLSAMLSNISEKHSDDDSNVMHSAIAKDGSVFLLSTLSVFFFSYVYMSLP